MKLLQRLGDHPNASLDEACGDRALTLAAYRLLEDDGIDPDILLVSHIQATAARVRPFPSVLVLHDTTDLDFGRRTAPTGLGPIGHGKHHGLLVHSSLATTLDGVPLGVLALQVWHRDPATVGIAKERRQRPIAKKESQKWLTGIEQSERTIGHACRLIHVMDREGDVFEVLQYATVWWRSGWSSVRRRIGPSSRPSRPRRGSSGRRLPASQSGRPGCSWWAGRPGRPTGRAVTLQVAEVTLRPPKLRQEWLVPVTVTALLVREVPPFAGKTPVEWLLLTTVPVTTVAEAWERVEWYALRWRIERFHFVLKSGCRVEERQLESAKAITKLLIFDAIVAWRLLYVTYQARLHRRSRRRGCPARSSSSCG